jgi:hypothetical protein
MLRFMVKGGRLAGLALVVLFAGGRSGRADLFTVGVNGGATATIGFTGQSSGLDVYTVPFSVTDTTTGSGSFAAFCVDLYHDQPLGTSTGEVGTTYTFGSLAGSTLLSNAFPNSGYSDLANRMNYRMSP